jgi:prophage maintenance system killer protein
MADFFLREGIPVAIVGPKDPKMLHSALSRQFVSLKGKYKWTSQYEIIATLFFGLIKNHPFHDGNKRTALLAALYHMWECGLCPDTKQRNLERITLAVAENSLSKYPAYNKFAKFNDPEVHFLARFFRKNTRRIDKRYYCVTFHQLNAILRRFDCRLVDPKGCRIDIIREKTRTIYKFPSGRQRVTDEIKLGQIGFPGWKSQVGKGAISYVRKVTNLTSSNGIDSQVFFHNMDLIDGLISTYYGPLKRLARK